jgi:hypothetical protein
MVIRELKDGRSYVSLQEDHAELAAQFAAHWGNAQFSQLRPYKTMVFATTYHDSGYREFEGNPPINVEKGRPYAHRENIPSFEAVELKAYAKNVDWLCSHDLYAGLIVSMHRTLLSKTNSGITTAPCRFSICYHFISAATVTLLRRSSKIIRLRRFASHTTATKKPS